jgi:hypothetical protein
MFTFKISTNFNRVTVMDFKKARQIIFTIDEIGGAEMEGFDPASLHHT